MYAIYVDFIYINYAFLLILILLIRFTAARLDFCESVAYALSMTVQDMVQFQAAYGPENKQGRARVLKAKFSVSILRVCLYMQMKR